MLSLAGTILHTFELNNLGRCTVEQNCAGVLITHSVDDEAELYCLSEKLIPKHAL